MGLEERFSASLESQTTAQIVDLIDLTWDEPEGALIREIGFDIIEERHGEEVSDQLYKAIYEAKEGR